MHNLMIYKDEATILNLLLSPPNTLPYTLSVKHLLHSCRDWQKRPRFTANIFTDKFSKAKSIAKMKVITFIYFFFALLSIIEAMHKNNIPSKSKSKASTQLSKQVLQMPLLYLQERIYRRRHLHFP
jgi:hypothetical protein